MAYLVASGDHRFKLGNDAMTLGTDPKADINITRGFDVAPSHVALEPRDQGHVLKPLSGSNYVTFVNDIRAEFPTVLEHDDHIKVGLLELRYQNPTIELSPTLQQTPTGEHSDNRPSKLTHNVLEKLTTEKPVRKVNHRQEAERKTKKAWAVLTFVAVSVCAAAIYFQWKTNQRNQTITDEPDARNPELLYELKKIPMPEPFLVWAGCGFQNPSPEWRRVPPKVVPTDADVCYVHPDKDKTFSLKVGRLDTWASFPEVMSEIERESMEYDVVIVGAGSIATMRYASSEDCTNALKNPSRSAPNRASRASRSTRHTCDVVGT